MNNIDELLESKLKKDNIEVLTLALEKLEKKSGGILGKILKKKTELSKENALLGLTFLDKIKDLRETDSQRSWYRSHVTQNDLRFNALKKIARPEDFWNEQRFPLLQFLFGEQMAPFVKKAWETIPSLMYQTGWDRRSFRGTEGLHDIYFTRQLNFIIDLIYEHAYNFSFTEYAIYSNHLSIRNFSFLYAAAIDLGDEEITSLFLNTIYGKEEIARPSRVIIKGMLLSQNKECWKAVEKLLLSAQRQEGLRQTILETLDETSLGAMKHIIRVILENKLTRFSSVVRSVDTWAGFGWEAEKESTVRRFLELGLKYLLAPEEIQKAVKSKDNGEVYMALWAQGVIDVTKTTPLLEEVVKGTKEKISLALYFVSQVAISSSSLHFGKLFFEHDDPVIRCQAVTSINDPAFIKKLQKKEKLVLFSKLEAKLEDLPKAKTASKPRVFSWMYFSYGKEILFDLMINLLDLQKEEERKKIIPYFSDLNVNHREKITGLVLPNYSGYGFDETLDRPTISDKERDFAFLILKDRSESVKRTAIRALADASLSDTEVQVFEKMLTRKSADFRRSAIQLITKNGKEQVIETAKRLLAAKNEDQRLAGLDLLLWLKKEHKDTQDWVKTSAQVFNERPKITNKETSVLKGLLGGEENSTLYTSENGFGLYDPSNIPSSISLKGSNIGVYKKAISDNPLGLSTSEKKVNIALADLGKIFEANKDFEYTYEDWEEKKTTALLGNNFNRILRKTEDMSPSEIFENYPLSDVWRSWFENSGLENRDLFIVSLFSKMNKAEIKTEFIPNLHKKLMGSTYFPQIPKYGKYDWQNPIFTILEILGYIFPYEHKTDYLSDLITDICQSISEKEVSSFIEVETYWKPEKQTWREHPLFRCIWYPYTSQKKEMSAQQFETYFNLSQWLYLTLPDDLKVEKDEIPPLTDYIRAYTDNLIKEDQLMWRVLHHDALSDLTRKPRADQKNLITEHPFLEEILEKSRSRILEIEMIRGDSSTEVTKLAQGLHVIYGIPNFVQVLQALGKDNLHRGYIYSWGSREYNRKEILSTLLKRCFPSPEDTQDQFNKLVKNSKITEKRLCDAATYSPQWLPFVAEYLGWKDMQSAVWWLHAHTNGHHDSQTETEIAKYSSVDITAFKDGAVDINWFREAYKSLGAAKWKTLYEAAKYISDGGGHKRGLLYADVILGKTKIKAIKDKIKATRNKDAVLVFGVIPLRKTNPAKDVLQRYQYLQKFKKESKQFGSQRQASEGIIVKIAMENLARTAGYPDPIRLQWAMETKEAQEIIANAGTLIFQETQISLNIDHQGKSFIKAEKEGKRLKAIPAKLRKNKEVLKLKEFNKTLREQYKRTRKSLEMAMINGDHFSKEEIETLSTHPVVAPIIKKLVLSSDENLGFFEDGKLLTIEGEEKAFGESIKIAHCVDLFEAKQWAAFQKYCFTHELVQPFKQIFRELYIPTADELKESAVSRRYAGHQVQPRKTLALLKGQGWTVDYEEGLQKVHHQQNIIARMYAMADWFSPADVEAPTLETISFYNRKDGKRKAFTEVNNRVFSETMRDIDLVVSVAHVGGVDPEASQSSIELRSVIVEETCRLFKLKNVSFSENHVKIEGTRGNYSVHLGSGICHKVASATLSIIPVHSQHRGRMFLPFIDDDPKTAEIVSKVLLLAKDEEIQDPTILSQL